MTIRLRKLFFSVYEQNKKFWIVSALLGSGGLFYYVYSKLFGKRRKVVSRFGKSKKRHKKHRTSVDAEFFQQLAMLLNISVPSVWSKEVFYLVILAIVLVMRTILSIRIADVNGTIVKAIVNRRFYTFIFRIATLGSIAIPASFVNSFLSYFTNRLALQFRTRLVHHFHDLYLSPKMYYKITNIDSRISTPDQAMTETLTLWGRSLSELYSNITKPLLDIVLFSLKLAELMGWEGPLSVLGYYTVSLFLIRIISPPFGTLAAITTQLEGKFRGDHHRLIAHSEEIAFYNGHKREKELLNRRYHELEEHNKYVLQQKFGMGAFNGFLQKYGSVMCGYSVLGLPVFGSKSEQYLKTVANSSDITQDYIRNSSLLINLSKAIGRIVTSYEAVQRLAGYTKMVSKLNVVLNDLNKDKYMREFVNPEKLEEKNLAPHRGKRTISNDGSIEFKKVSIVTPNGDILVNRVTFKIIQGQNLFIKGPNGCGKSSLFRMLGGLWPQWDGEISAPKDSVIYYIPQKPYLVEGTFRDQIIYPDNKLQMLAKGFTDNDILEFLKEVKLEYLLEKMQTWDSVQDWFDVLSGGEKQRVAMARIFYHKPQFAILDECTSAVSVDVESHMYEKCKEIGCTLITISHRPSLWKHHEYLLDLDGRGHYKFGKMVLPESYTGIP